MGRSPWSFIPSPILEYSSVRWPSCIMSSPPTTASRLLKRSAWILSCVQVYMHLIPVCGQIYELPGGLKIPCRDFDGPVDHPCFQGTSKSHSFLTIGCPLLMLLSGAINSRSRAWSRYGEQSILYDNIHSALAFCSAGSFREYLDFRYRIVCGWI